MKATAYRKQLSSLRRTQPAYYLSKRNVYIHSRLFFPCLFSHSLLPHSFFLKTTKGGGKAILLKCTHAC